MADPVNTMAVNSLSRISTEPTSPRRWSSTVGGTKLGPAYTALMGSMSAVDARPSDTARKKGLVNQEMLLRR